MATGAGLKKLLAAIRANYRLGKAAKATRDSVSPIRASITLGTPPKGPPRS